MWLLSVTDQRSAALAQYESCCRILDQELGVPPAEETTALYEKIKLGRPAEMPGPVQPTTGARQLVNAPPQIVVSAVTSMPAGQRFVGREKELTTLRAALLAAIGGNGQQMFVVGGAGRGKSSLIREFVRTTQADLPELLIAMGRCTAREGIGDPYLPFHEILHQLTGDVRSTGGGVMVERVQAGNLSRVASITIPLLVEEAPDLIGSFVPAQQLLAKAEALGSPDSPWLRRLAVLANSKQSAQLEQPRLFVQIAAFLATVAARRPLVLVLEDLQWADASSISLMFHLNRVLASSRILILGTYRPEAVLIARNHEQHPLAGVLGELKRHQGQIWVDLAQQSLAEERAFVDAYLDSEPNLLDENFRSRLFSHTRGHALFTVEVLRELETRGELVRDDDGNWVLAHTIDWNALPAKVEGVIEQRIGAVDKELRAYLTIAAVEGESFTAEIIASILGEDARVVVRRLSQALGQEHRLVQAQSIEHSGEQRLSRFRFRHQLFQHYLYRSLSAAERMYYHEDIGNALESFYGQRAPEFASVLAEHFQAAGSTQKAVRYLTVAAQQASMKTANLEAAHFARTGLALLEAIPPGAERMKLELLLQIIRGRSAMYSEGYAASDAEAGFVRAMQLCEQMGRIPQIFPVMYGLWALYLIRGEFEAARQQAQRLIALAAEQGNTRSEMLGHGMMGLPLCWMGALAAARDHLERLAAWYEPQHDAENTSIYGQAALLARLTSLPMVLCMQGFADQARDKCSQFVQMSETLSDPISRAFALSFAGIVYQLLHDVEQTDIYAEKIVAHCQKQGIPFWLAYGLVLRGWVLSMQGDPHGTALMREQIDHLRQGQELAGTPWLISLLAEGYARTGRLQAALEATDEGLALAAAIGDAINRCFLSQTRADILMASALADSSASKSYLQDAETLLLTAINLAHQTGNKLGSLRAAISLCHLWQNGANGARGLEMLQGICASYVEGFDSVDLRGAKALLAAHG